MIDAHQHFWHYRSADFPWITDKLQVLKRDFLPEELGRILERNGVSGCVAVQAAQHDKETHFLLDLADANPFIRGVVGWIDLEAFNLSEKLHAYLPFSKLKGFRHILQDEEDPSYILRPGFQKGLDVIFERGYTYDLLVFPHQLDGALQTVRNFPEAPMVIDHLAKPGIAKGEIHSWKEKMQSFGEFPHVYGKLSGMVTEHTWDSWKPADFLPYLETMMEVFGEDRLMFGSDWPVCLLAGTYEEVKGVVELFLEGFSPEVRRKVWADNAVRFYSL
ncbi:L-fuconolactone hydrolase [Lunatimonas lonarensis]|uniref:L-fuconolactone hydrolase n=2 Tax=Lunatimonas lonarensis TaxID=1232681 RepID=R7ZVZ9_9BACT|nr:L-fuconolactone hydrolase [Lunatimonas lonarensis]